MNAAGLGIIIRDANGNIVAVVDWWCNEYRYPKMWKMEALPCHCVVELASEVGVHEIQNGQRPAFAGGASVTYNDKITWLLMLWQGKQKILIHGKFRAKLKKSQNSQTRFSPPALILSLTAATQPPGLTSSVLTSRPHDLTASRPQPHGLTASRPQPYRLSTVDLHHHDVAQIHSQPSLFFWFWVFAVPRSLVARFDENSPDLVRSRRIW
uniref:Uncharacterized protein n=1 Tax=Fagus sylvatica TaxID=28930 RepID=A0A2N9GGU4_FAGSY